MHTVYLALGSNLGDKKQNIMRAIEAIEYRIGSIVRQSDIIVTEPQGFESPNAFFNMVVCVSSELAPIEILDITQEIERSLGRTRKSAKGRYHDRTIDIDILLYDNAQITTRRLTIPHTRMTQRRFVMQPLAQIAPELIIPGEKQTTTELLAHIS